MLFKCLECGAEFDSERSLHAHIKKHDMFLHDYYTKHYARRDLLTGDLLPFKNKDQYFNTYFLNRNNQRKVYKLKNSYSYKINCTFGKGVKERPLNYTEFRTCAVKFSYTRRKLRNHLK